MTKKYKNNNRIILILYIIIVTLIAGLFSSCSSPAFLRKGKENQYIEKSSFMLDTIVNIKLYGADNETGYKLIDHCLEECRRYELIFSCTDEQSELYALNSKGDMEVSDELLEVLKQALHYCDLSGGAFDITLGAVSRLYGFSSDNPHVPADDEISEELLHCGYKKIAIEGNHVTLTDPKATIDLGAIAKGYIADRLSELIIESGQNSAIISLGGNIVCIGSKGDKNFNVGIKYPFRDTNDTIAVVGVSNCSVVTSGIYERSFEKDGILYHHILSPKDGRPVNNSLISVSIISDRSIDGDALSTVCFVLGQEKGMELINSLEGIDAMFVDEDLRVCYSDGFESKLIEK